MRDKKMDKPSLQTPLLLPQASEELDRRDREKKNAGWLHTLMILSFLFAGTIASILSPKAEYSLFENRMLEKKPAFSIKSLLNGSYTHGWEVYYSDTFPLREQMVRVAAQIRTLYGIHPDEVRIHNAAPLPQPDLSQNVSSAPPKTDSQSPQTPSDASAPPSGTQNTDPASQPPSPVPPTQSADDGAVGEKQGSVFIYKGQAMELFSPNETASRLYAQVLNDWQNTLGENVCLYNLIVPTHIAFALPEKYSDISQPQKPNIDFIYSLLNPAIRTVDAYSQLEKHSQEYLYFATDHHWTGLGAYYAYQAFCQQAGLQPVALEQMEKRTLNNFVGSLYGQTQDPSLLKNPDHVDYWIIPTPHSVLQYRRGDPFTGYSTTLLGEYAQSPNSYSVFLQGDYPLTKVTTNLQNGRKIAVVKESFGNAFCPFLVNHYEEVHIVDQRYFQLNLADYIRENGIDEVLFINNIFAANTTIRINEIARLRTQVYVPYTPPAIEEPASSSQEEKKPGRVEFDPWAEEEKHRGD